MKKRKAAIALAIAIGTLGFLQPNSTVSAKEGKVLNIYCWNNEFKQVLTQAYPGYTNNLDGTGRIGNVIVNWVQTPFMNNMYLNNLDAALLENNYMETDEQVDMFLIEPDYALKYLNSDFVMKLKDLGITKNDIVEQYNYTIDLGKDQKGNLKAISWQATPGLFVYRRSIARDVLGTDNPGKVQEYLSSWNNFNKTAEKMGENGYTMLAGYSDSFRVFEQNKKTPWVVNGKINIDKKLMDWVDQTKIFTDKGYNHKAKMWSDKWAIQQGSYGNTFGFFYPTWGLNYTLIGYSLDVDESDGGKLVKGNGTFGDWAVCCGPDSYYWGGSFLCARKGTDNKKLIASIMKKLACNKTNLKKLTTPYYADYVNNRTVIKEFANASIFKKYNAYKMYDKQSIYKWLDNSGKELRLKNLTAYDNGLNELFQNSMMYYFSGVRTKKEAINDFYVAAKLKYPELYCEIKR